MLELAQLSSPIFGQTLGIAIFGNVLTLLKSKLMFVYREGAFFLTLENIQIHSSLDQSCGVASYCTNVEIFPS